MQALFGPIEILDASAVHVLDAAGFEIREVGRVVDDAHQIRLSEPDAHHVAADRFVGLDGVAFHLAASILEKRVLPSGPRRRKKRLRCPLQAFPSSPYLPLTAWWSASISQSTRRARCGLRSISRCIVNHRSSRSPS